MKTLSLVLALAAGLVLASNLSAADTGCGKKACDKAAKAKKHAMLDFLKGITLTDDQQTKVDALAKDYQPKFKANADKAAAVITPEQKKAREDAVKAAKAEGKKGKELGKVAAAAVTLTDEQKSTLADVSKAGKSLSKEFHDKVIALLTPEQTDQLKAAHQHKKGSK